MEINFTDKVVLVTGGSRGIGAAVAEKFAEAGAVVIISFNNDKKSAKKVLSSLEGNGHNAVKCDISDPLLSAGMIERIVDEYGKIDILVNNAGIYEERSFQGSDYDYWLETWNRTIALNLMGAANLAFLAGKYMVENGG
ncbi:MAG: SDR family NAD(P)-dependent oxidoreductase, partial [Candidatus Aminicenantes bacterium]|nr:SDR family NAD(P)-dependent oxidoreductase [Candidatus Aminicenantes bacterium]